MAIYKIVIEFPCHKSCLLIMHVCYRYMVIHLNRNTYSKLIYGNLNLLKLGYFVLTIWQENDVPFFVFCFCFCFVACVLCNAVNLAHFSTLFACRRTSGDNCSAGE